MFFLTFRNKKKSIDNKSGKWGNRKLIQCFSPSNNRLICWLTAGIVIIINYVMFLVVCPAFINDFWQTNSKATVATCPVIPNKQVHFCGSISWMNRNRYFTIAKSNVLRYFICLRMHLSHMLICFNHVACISNCFGTTTKFCWLHKIYCWMKHSFSDGWLAAKVEQMDLKHFCCGSHYWIL